VIIPKEPILNLVGAGYELQVWKCKETKQKKSETRHSKEQRVFCFLRINLKHKDQITIITKPNEVDNKNKKKTL